MRSGWYWSNYGEWSTVPQIDSVAPATGPHAGGTVVTVTGTGFVASTTSTLGTVSVLSPTSLQITTTGQGSAGSVSWTLTTPGIGTSNPQTFTYT